jgi:hypothetical protein
VYSPPAAETQALAWLQRDPQSATALAVRAEQLAAADVVEGAVDLIERALDLAASTNDPLGLLPDLHTQLGMLFLRQGETSVALEEAQLVLGSKPDHRDAHELRVMALRAANEMSALLAEQLRWTEVKPDDVAAWRHLATFLLGDFGQTLPDAKQRALAAASRADWLAKGRDREALELRAQAHTLLGEMAAAALCREQAATLPATTR